MSHDPVALAFQQARHPHLALISNFICATNDFSKALAATTKQLNDAVATINQANKTLSQGAPDERP